MMFISIQTYQVYTMDPMLFCINNGTFIPFIRNKIANIIVYYIDSLLIPIIQYHRDFPFEDTDTEAKEMVELLLLTPWHNQDIPIMLDVVNVNVPGLLCLGSLPGINPCVDHVPRHLRNWAITRQHSLKYGERRKTNLIWHGENLYVSQKASL